MGILHRAAYPTNRQSSLHNNSWFHVFLSFTTRHNLHEFFASPFSGIACFRFLSHPVHIACSRTTYNWLVHVTFGLLHMVSCWLLDSISRLYFSLIFQLPACSLLLHSVHVQAPHGPYVALTPNPLGWYPPLCSTGLWTAPPESSVQWTPASDPIIPSHMPSAMTCKYKLLSWDSETEVVLVTVPQSSYKHPTLILWGEWALLIRKDSLHPHNSWRWPARPFHALLLPLSSAHCPTLACVTPALTCLRPSRVLPLLQGCSAPACDRTASLSTQVSERRSLAQTGLPTSGLPCYCRLQCLPHPAQH